MGRFKNKKVKIKSIDTNEKGDLLINGRTALKFRMPDGGKVLLPKPPEMKNQIRMMILTKTKLKNF